MYRKYAFVPVLFCLSLPFFYVRAAASEPSRQNLTAEEKQTSGVSLTDEQENTDSDAVKAPSVEGEWIEDGDDWRYRLPDGTFLRSSWLEYGGSWYYFTSSGYMQQGIRKIDGKSYYFRESGEMITGWYFDEDEEKWYHCGEDGAMTTGWYQAGDAWYWFDSKGAMYSGGFRMVTGHKYYFFENGQLAAGQYVETDYYDENGYRDKSHDIIINGHRKPDKEEEDQITEAMSGIPRKWIVRFIEDGWELMFYTDKSYFSAPATEQGIYYIYYDTDSNYKKIKFCNPADLAVAFGEYVAYATGNDGDESNLMADYYQYLSDTTLVDPLPSYFDQKPEMQFASLFAAFCREEVRADMKQKSPFLYKSMTELLEMDTQGQKPEEGDMIEMNGDPYIDFDGKGPASDEFPAAKPGPAGEG